MWEYNRIKHYSQIPGEGLSFGDCQEIRKKKEEEEETTYTEEFKNVLMCKSGSQNPLYIYIYDSKIKLIRWKQFIKSDISKQYIYHSLKFFPE